MVLKDTGSFKCHEVTLGVVFPMTFLWLWFPRMEAVVLLYFVTGQLGLNLAVLWCSLSFLSFQSTPTLNLMSPPTCPCQQLPPRWEYEITHPEPSLHRCGPGSGSRLDQITQPNVYMVRWSFRVREQQQVINHRTFQTCWWDIWGMAKQGNSITGFRCYLLTFLACG